MSRDQTYRVFIAIELPSLIRRQIKEHIDQLRSRFPHVRASWSREDNLHLTLKFLGEIPISRIPALSESCSEAIEQIEPFDLTVRGCGTFPAHGKPKVLWIGIEDTDAEAQTSPLHKLHAAVENSCAAFGFEREVRPYHPHLTIARIREANDSRVLAEHHRQTEFATPTFTVSQIVVFSSQLSKEGSRHSPLSRHELGPKRQL
jgi:2'-5' RNA ligase